LQSPPAARAYQAHRVYQAHRPVPARRPSCPGRLTTDNRVPDPRVPQVRAQMGTRSRVPTNIQAPNPVGVNRRRAVKDTRAQNTGENRVQVTSDRLAPAISGGHPASDRKAPIIRPRRPARAPRPLSFHITWRGPRVQSVQTHVQPRRPLLAKPRLPRLRGPAPPQQPDRALRPPQPRYPRLRHPRRPSLRRQPLRRQRRRRQHSRLRDPCQPLRRPRRHNSPGDRTLLPPADRRMPRGILDMPATAAPGRIEPRPHPPRVRSLPWPRSRSRSHTPRPRARGVRGQRRVAPGRPVNARRRS
jgi:hypothetical protein